MEKKSHPHGFKAVDLLDVPLMFLEACFFFHLFCFFTLYSQFVFMTNIDNKRFTFWYNKTVYCPYYHLNFDSSF